MRRLQRLKTTAALRDLVAEIGFGRAQLVQPLFVVEGLGAPEAVPGLGDNERLPLGDLGPRVARDLEAGVRQFMLFVVPAAKQARGFDPAFAGRAIEAVKQRTGGAATVTGPAGTLKAADEDLLVFADTSLGNTTAGTWNLYFDSSDVLLKLGDVVAAGVDANGDILFAVDKKWVMGALTVNTYDVGRCVSPTTGANSACGGCAGC